MARSTLSVHGPSGRVAVMIAEAAGEVFEVDDFALLSGRVLPRVRIVFETHGSLSPARDNVILFSTWFTSLPSSNRWLIGPGRALDPNRWFIVCAGLLGNGASSSPSNTPAPDGGAGFPSVATLDNVRLQRRLLHERFGVDRLALVMGRSAGSAPATRRERHRRLHRPILGGQLPALRRQ